MTAPLHSPPAEPAGVRRAERPVVTAPPRPVGRAYGAADRVAEQLRRLAARSTREIALRRGRELGMVVGCGFPKSGTVWLCQLMATYLGLPYPRSYSSPIAMASVIHAHWRYDTRLPPTIYITRDGRDVMISLYFYLLRSLGGTGGPAATRALQARLAHLYGPGFDPAAVRDNLPKFVEWQMTQPSSSAGLRWHEHVTDWRDRAGVGQVSYEGLLADPVTALCAAFETITGTSSPRLATIAVDRWSFAVASGRAAGDEDRGSFLRKGVSGDWRTYFSREAGEVFDAAAGQTLVDLGYASSRSWWASL